MNTEELIKQMAQAGITVQGDLVMEKHVGYEVSNVEAGGIGIQVVNGEVKAAQAASGKKPLDGKEATLVKEPLPDRNQEKPSPGPRKQYLFIEGDASWEKQGKQRDPSKENVVVCRRERDRFLRYLSLHSMGNRYLTTRQDDVLNSIVASFLVVWRDNGLIAKDFSGNAVYRFLHDECGIKTEVDEKSYANKITPWVNNKKYLIEVLAEVENYFFSLIS